MLDVVVVNWNAGLQLRTCIDSVAQYGEGLVKRIIVVDNDSTDGSEETVNGLSKVTLIRAGENFGFGRACNLGAAKCDSEFLLFLNPDAALLPDTLTKTVAFMQEAANTRVGICGVQLLDESGQVARHCARFPSPSSYLAHAFGLDRIIPKLGHFMAEWNHRQTRQVDQVIGAFFFVRYELFKALNGFDERFFVYFEEVDFSRRAMQIGWPSVYLADTSAFHAGNGTTRQVKAERLFYSLRSRLLYAFKHFNVLGVSIVLLTTLFIEPISRATLACGQCSRSAFGEIWKAYGLLYRWLPRWALYRETS